MWLWLLYQVSDSSCDCGCYTKGDSSMWLWLLYQRWVTVPCDCGCYTKGEWQFHVTVAAIPNVSDSCTWLAAISKVTVPRDCGCYIKGESDSSTWLWLLYQSEQFMGQVRNFFFFGHNTKCRNCTFAVCSCVFLPSFLKTRKNIGQEWQNSAIRMIKSIKLP